MNLKPGFVLQRGKYTIDSVLGEGGFGITYRAIHNDLSQIVVLKTLNKSLHNHQDFSKFQLQFRAEANLIANSQHPNIVRVWDFFEEEQLCFMVMDYVPGKNLAELIESGHNLPPNQAIHYIHQIASAISLVHKNGFLHRDIQPKNIIRRAGTNTVVLTDFGIACNLTSGIRQTHTNLFSVGYAPPEQSNSQENLTPATDIYALTATFYYLLTGKAPIPAALRVSQAIPQSVQFPLHELKLVLPNLHPAIEKTIVRGLEIDPKKRPQAVDKWFKIMLEKSNNLDLIPEKNILKEKLNSLTNDDDYLQKNIVNTVDKSDITNHFEELEVNHAKKIHLAQNQFLNSSDSENKFSRINQLCLQLTILLMFVFTAATFGWIGFDITRRYSYTEKQKTVTLTSDKLLENLKRESNSHFRTPEPSSSLFDSPSVKTYSVTPPRLNKMPKQNFYEEEIMPNSESASDENTLTSFPEKQYYSSDSKSQLPDYNYSEFEDKYQDDYY